MDNCSDQRNRWMLRFPLHLIELGLADRVIFFLLPENHGKEQADRVHSIILVNMIPVSNATF